MGTPLTSKQKALAINLDENIYGTFAEVGAGQEVVRYFFRSGGASGTIAKAMSAYDKDFSDAIYGVDPSGRYVTKKRLINMISHEYRLMQERLDREKHPDKCFFSFANTVATINYSRTFQGHGWMGIRFQQEPNKEPNDVVLHFRLHDQEAGLQQEAVGVLGVNLVYSCFHFPQRPLEALQSLYDNLDRHRLEIDMIQLDGPDFEHVDNRLLSLYLVKTGMTEAVIFGPDGNNIHPSEVLYKKNILAMRGSFRPVTRVHIDMITNGYKAFVEEKRVEEENICQLVEITLSNLKAEGDIDEQDFLDRADLLCSLGQTVLVSDFSRYYKLVDYFSRYTKARMGLIIGVDNLLAIFDDSYYHDLNGGILEAFGILFTRDLKMFLYPSQAKPEDPLLNRHNLPIQRKMKPLYDYLNQANRIQDLEGIDHGVLSILSAEVLRMIREGIPGWEILVPGYVDNVIKDKQLFGYRSETGPE